MGTTLVVEVGKDKKTGYPCVRLASGKREPTDAFAGLIPITKCQVEQFIWENACPHLEGQADTESARIRCITDLLKHVELSEGCGEVPEPVRKLIRKPLRQLSSDEVPSIIATNLNVWNEGKDLFVPDGVNPRQITIPTKDSEWGLITNWLGCRPPRLEEWIHVRDGFAGLPTTKLLEETLALYPLSDISDRAVRHVLHKLRNSISTNACGIPLLCLYELVSDVRIVRRTAVDPQRQLQPGKEWRPSVAGDSPFWPHLDVEGALPSQQLLSQNAPVVALRPWYRRSGLRNDFQQFECALSAQDSAGRTLGENQPEPPHGPALGPAPAKRRWLLGQFKRAEVPRLPLDGSRSGSVLSELRRVPSSNVDLELRCPQCLERVEEDIFRRGNGFYCYLDRQKPAPGAEQAWVRKHGLERPRLLQEDEYDVVPQRYLEIANTNNSKGNIRIVLMIGPRRAGKTVALATLGGVMDNTDGESTLYRAFPESWEFKCFPCAPHSFEVVAKDVDLRLSTDRIKLDGLLPRRTEPGKKAARFPVHFKCNPKGSQRSRELITVFADFPGELLGLHLDSDNYPHVPYATDIVLFVPAADLSTQPIVDIINLFPLTGSGDKAINLKTINLIVVFTKIDTLLYGSDDEQNLLKCILPSPYRFPTGDSTDLKRYFDEMETVHFNIERWLGDMKNKKREFLDLAGKTFGSFRMTGISSCGAAPRKTPAEQEGFSEFAILFPPQPIRVVDPLFWILKDNGLVGF